jgi:sugar phosphate isomerase/epimerase
MAAPRGGLGPVFRIFSPNGKRMGENTTMMTTRRSLLAAAVSGLAPRLDAAKLGRHRLSVITDETGDTVEEWIAFAREHRLSWVEMRTVGRPGQHVMAETQTPAELKPIARRLQDNGLRVSFLNSALLKYTLPGTQPVITEDYYDKLYKRLGLTSEGLYRDRRENLKKAIAAAQALGTDKLRTFTFWRVKEPRALFPRIRDLLGEMGETAGREGSKLLVETEFATNVATSEEIRDILAGLPSKAIAINWDPQNSYELEPDVFPGGYHKLPKARILNVQVKAEGLFGKKRLDWGAILAALLKDGYGGLVGLETHHGHGPENYKMSHRAMQEMQRLAGETS